jgi:hypothetical protein
MLWGIVTSANSKARKAELHLSTYVIVHVPGDISDVQNAVVQCVYLVTECYHQMLHRLTFWMTVLTVRVSRLNF